MSTQQTYLVVAGNRATGEMRCSLVRAWTRDQIIYIFDDPQNELVKIFDEDELKTIWMEIAKRNHSAIELRLPSLALVESH